MSKRSFSSFMMTTFQLMFLLTIIFFSSNAYALFGFNKISEYTIEVPKVEQINVSEISVSAVQKKKTKTKRYHGISILPFDQQEILLHEEVGENEEIAENELQLVLLNSRDIDIREPEPKKINPPARVVVKKTLASGAKKQSATIEDQTNNKSVPAFSISSSELLAMVNDIAPSQTDAQPIQIKPIPLSLDQISNALRIPATTQVAEPKPQSAAVPAVVATKKAEELAQKNVEENTPQPEPRKKEKSNNKPAAIFSAQVFVAFAETLKPVENAKVQVIGTGIATTTDQSGYFEFSNLKIAGVLPVLVSDPEGKFLSRRVDLKPGEYKEVKLVSKNAALLASRAVQKEYSEKTALFFGEISAAQGRRAGLIVKMDPIDAMGTKPMAEESNTIAYMDSQGALSTQSTMTSEKGQFALVNFRPGTYILTLRDALGQEFAPHVVSVAAGEGVVQSVSLGTSRVIYGKILGTNEKPIPGTYVQLLGSTKQVLTDENGAFSLGPVGVDCDDMNALLVQRNTSNFYRSFVDFRCTATTQQAPANFYVFHGTEVDSFSDTAGLRLDPDKAVVVGNARTSKQLKIQLWGPDEIDPPNSELQQATHGADFYFDENGNFSRFMDRTASNGNFAILNAPTGLSYIQAFGSKNQTVWIAPILNAPSTVNVYIR